MKNLYQLSKNKKLCLMLSTDLLLLPAALWSAIVLRIGTFSPHISRTYWLFIAAPILAVPLFIKLGLYRQVVRYIETKFLYTVLEGVTLSVLLLVSVEKLFDLPRISISATVIYWLLAVVYITATRMIVRTFYRSVVNRPDEVRHLIIYGAGQTGSQLVNALRVKKSVQPVAFIDDNRELWKRSVSGLVVYSPDKLHELMRKYNFKEVLLAMPSATNTRRREIIAALERHALHVKTVPDMQDLLSGKIQVDNTRDLDIEDLLGRDPVPPDERLLDACIRGKSVMVTGAGGSIGAELCRQILKLNPKRLVLFERSEFALYQVHQELQRVVTVSASEVELIPLLGSVTDQYRVSLALRNFNVQTVYHAAAYKHVPLVEYNVIEGVKNNIFGTLRCAEAAIANKVEAFVLISTDKAVRPTNVMGATKRFSELILQGMAKQYHNTRFTMVRFGNVLGSSGSVVPLFRKQIKQGGPITITHPEITRYFMTIPEASQLVLQAGAMGRGGDVFVLNMGQPVKILELARQMVHLSGFTIKDKENPNGDIEIVATGLRPGEKLYEELLIGDNVENTQHPRIMRANEAELPWGTIIDVLDKIADACEKGDVATIRDQMLKHVDGYQPQCGIEDFIWVASKQKIMVTESI